MITINDFKPIRTDVLETSGELTVNLFTGERTVSINYSSILTRLIQEAGRICEFYASDINGRFGRGYADWFNETLLKVENFLDSLNYDHGDPMRDYFDVGFYAHIDIGKWDKPFKLKGAKK